MFNGHAAVSPHPAGMRGASRHIMRLASCNSRRLATVTQQAGPSAPDTWPRVDGEPDARSEADGDRLELDGQRFSSARALGHVQRCCLPRPCEEHGYVHELELEGCDDHDGVADLQHAVETPPPACGPARPACSPL
eukprot:6191475-Pleurochrysis_carterae.AAC.1